MSKDEDDMNVWLCRRMTGKKVKAAIEPGATDSGDVVLRGGAGSRRRACVSPIGEMLERHVQRVPCSRGEQAG